MPAGFAGPRPHRHGAEDLPAGPGAVVDDEELAPAPVGLRGRDDAAEVAVHRQPCNAGTAASGRDRMKTSQFVVGDEFTGPHVDDVDARSAIALPPDQIIIDRTKSSMLFHRD